MMPLLNLHKIEAVHNEVDARLHMITSQDAGMAHNHRRVLLEALKEERRASGAEAVLLENAALKARLSEVNAQMDGLKAQLKELAFDNSTLRADLATTRRGLMNHPAGPHPETIRDGREEGTPPGTTFPGPAQSPPSPPPPPAPALVRTGASRLPQLVEESDAGPVVTPPLPVATRADGTPRFKPCWRCQDVIRCAKSNHCPLGENIVLQEEED